MSQTIIERKLLWNGGTSSIKVPHKAKLGTYPEEDVRLPFLFFNHWGLLRMYIHNPSREVLERFRGSVIRGELEVWKRRQGDTIFTHLDFRNTRFRDEAMSSTHRWLIIGKHKIQFLTWPGAVFFPVTKKHVLAIAPK